MQLSGQSIFRIRCAMHIVTVIEFAGPGFPFNRLRFFTSILLFYFYFFVIKLFGHQDANNIPKSHF